MKKILIRIVAFIAATVAFILTKTLRYKLDQVQLLETKRCAGGRHILFAFFHGKLLSLLGLPHLREMVAISSLSRDGEIMSCVLRYFGFTVIRGSSSRGGFGALRCFIREVRSGRSGCIAVDGPRGPYRTVKKGILQVARLSSNAIVPVGVQCSRKIVLNKSWDRFEIPLPFSCIRVLFEEPIVIAEDTNSGQLDLYRLRLERKLREINPS